jgi:nucleotide-binding universal stress UspA family protein
MSIFKKALIVSDLSEPSEKFLQCKAGLRSLGVDHVVLAFCLRLHEVRGVRANVEDILKDDLDRCRKMLKTQGYTAETEMLLGDPRVEVNRAAKDKGCDLVVVGSRVHSLTGEVLLGGTAGEVLHSCRLPLLVARIHEDKDCPRECPLASLDRVLLPTDFSENAEHAFQSVRKLTAGGVKSVVLVHVQDRTKIDRHLKERLEEFNVIDGERLERMKEQLISQGAEDVQLELPYGLPVEEILRRTRQGDISLTVMGSQGRGFISEIFLGSVSHNVARHAPVPTLLIPALR